MVEQAQDRQVVVVTGGTSGIGRSVAADFARTATVVVVGRDPERVAAMSAETGVAGVTADVGVRADVERLADHLREQHGRVDVLVNCAGFLKAVSPTTPLPQAEEAWDAVVDANLKGAFLVSQALMPMLASPGGRIVNISSIAAVTGGSGSAALAYAAAKAGLIGLTYSQARGLGPSGITANAIAPGFVADTGFTGDWPEERIRSIVAQTPVGRAGHTDDVVAATRYLASAEASFVTGQVLHVNGGWAFGR
ncbi:SDR family NAD(P)-dependent oxidoreductase [Streptacidiphilus melanogenes]|uniref:SDR family NAD(P)-dependent oxidoreductase n=1 Tax=Streptacidiphilus melanogenes TaxID=411235 RepID=UPI0005A7C501|nr:SDR family oxidoreductase [Streptacidiphilus melanogenes]